MHTSSHEFNDGSDTVAIHYDIISHTLYVTYIIKMHAWSVTSTALSTDCRFQLVNFRMC